MSQIEILLGVVAKHLEIDFVIVDEELDRGLVQLGEVDLGPFLRGELPGVGAQLSLQLPALDGQLGLGDKVAEIVFESLQLSDAVQAGVG